MKKENSIYRNDLVKGEMAAQDLTIGDLAVKSGVSEFTVKAIRNGESHVSVARLVKVTDALEIPRQRLFEPKKLETAQTA